MTAFDPKECERLIAKARTERRSPDPDPFSDDPGQGETDRCMGWNDACDYVAVPLADQLESAVREVAFLRGETERLADEDTERYRLRDEVAMLAKERDAMRAVVSAIIDYTDEFKPDAETCALEKWRRVERAIDAYRAAKEKP